MDFRPKERYLFSPLAAKGCFLFLFLNLAELNLNLSVFQELACVLFILPVLPHFKDGQLF